MSKVAIIIPARYASTRFPGKPLHVIAGKPLIQHVWERCCRAKRADTVIVATDDMRIAEAAFDFGAEVSLTSDKHPTGTDRIAEVAARLRGYSHILNVQGDEPDADPRLLDRLAKTLLDDRRLPMVTACFPFADAVEAASPNNVKVVLRPDGDALYFSRSLIPFDRNALGEGRAKASPGHLRIQPEVFAAICEVETDSSGKNRMPGAAQGPRKWRAHPRDHRKAGKSRCRYP